MVRTSKGSFAIGFLLVEPSLLAAAVQPNPVGPAGPVPAVVGVWATAVVAAAEIFWEAVVGGIFLVKMVSAAIFIILKRRSVETCMAVGQLAIFRSVGRCLADAVKNANLCRFRGHFDGSTL